MAEVRRPADHAPCGAVAALGRGQGQGGDGVRRLPGTGVGADRAGLRRRVREAATARTPCTSAAAPGRRPPRPEREDGGGPGRSASDQENWMPPSIITDWPVM
ncbi:hypothetical protein TPA0910_08800 [Streptomyces hygroscopicus subsp. sporocinereus]|uniref:Uncharacterized protein n=1 Tax=Streptomyces hygroscopicus TaxID=1912 RepID=A0ABQ3TSY9_STRHY|nr:hypothetical protein TPA0910_08800 [Streptomyces hygroscopicus]